MKRIFTLLFLTAFVSELSYGQAAIPNGGFENFNASGSHNPTNWATSDDIVTGLGLSSPGTVVQDTNAANVYAGTSSVVLTTKAVSVPTIGNITFAGSMSLGKYGFTVSNFQVTLGGVAYTDRPDSIEFAYKYDLPNGADDSALVTVNLSKASVNDGTIPIGSARVYLYYTGANFAIAKAKINYVSAQNPDTLKMQAQSSASLFNGGADGAQLWLDDMHFTGLDTIFKVYLTPNRDFTRCDGDTITIRTDDIAGDSYIWYLNGGQLFNQTSYKILTGVAGQYSLLVTHGGAIYPSDTITLTINPLPVVTLTGAVDSVCDNGSDIQLSGGSPSGGFYSGTGVAGGNFNPSPARIGSNTVRYTFVDNNGCRATATKEVYVWGCSVGVDVLQADAQISIYPNPASTSLFITGNDEIMGGVARIYDVQGRLIRIIDVTSAHVQIDLNAVSTGMYHVVISGKANAVIGKAKVIVAK